MFVLVGLTVVTGLLGSFIANDHLSSTKRIAEEAEPAIVNARQIQTSLAEANAAAANGLLTGGVEDPAQRQLYSQALKSSATGIETTARLINEDDETHVALSDMTDALARYSGRIESARANNRQGLPVGGAYLDDASSILSDEIYPGTDLVANRAAARYRSSYDRQRGSALILGIIAIALVLIVLAALLYLQLRLYQRFRRTLNPPIALATLVTLVLAVWMATAQTNQTSHLTTAREDGYFGTRLYLDARGIGFGAKADEARFLIARGGGEDFEDSFQARAADFDSLTADLRQHASDSQRGSASGATEDTISAWLAYVDEHNSIVAADRAGDREAAVATAKGSAADSFRRFDAATAEALAENDALFRSEMDAAQRSLRGLRFGVLLLSLLIAGLTAFGLQQRINEYR